MKIFKAEIYITITGEDYLATKEEVVHCKAKNFEDCFNYIKDNFKQYYLGVVTKDNVDRVSFEITSISPTDIKMIN